MLRLHGDLVPIKFRDLRDTELESYVAEILTQNQSEQFARGRDLDFSYISAEGGRFRVNVFRKDTGAEQGITISEQSNLDQSEVERMLAEAEAHRREDEQLRKQVDARNELDSAAYQVERRLAELGDSAAPHDRARAEMLIADARQAVKDDTPMDRVQSLTSELQQVLYGLQPMPSGGGNGQPSGDGRGSPVGDDDVVDAEFDRG